MTDGILVQQVQAEVEKSEVGQKKVSTNCRVPIVEVNEESASDTWSTLIEAINAATYIALDLVSELVSLHRYYVNGLETPVAESIYYMVCIPNKHFANSREGLRKSAYTFDKGCEEPG